MSYRRLFEIKPGQKLKLSGSDPAFTAKHKNKAAATKDLEKYTQRLRELQYLLYAEGKRSLLICLQALDAAGKDGTINHVLGNMNPQGTRVHGFKVPSKEEAAHDFLWRIHRQTPAKGEVVIFNRSHYEDVLVARVHKLVPKEVWSKRYDLINDFEKNLADQRHAHPQVLSAHQPGRATAAVQAADRRSRAPLENQRERLRRTRILGRLHEGL